MTPATQAQLFTAVRYVLMLAGGWLATHGYIKDTNVNDLVSALMIIGPAAWGFVTNYLAERRIKQRETHAVTAGIVAAVTDAVPSGPVTPAVAQQIIKTYTATAKP